MIANHNLSAVAEDVAKALTEVNVRGGSAFISTPLLYPSGAHSVIRIDGTGDRWFVSDDGHAHLEAELMGGMGPFRRIARPMAERAGIEFDERCFFVIEVDRDALPGAVTVVANVSKQVAERTAFAIEERRIALSRDVFEDRLVRAFGAQSITHEIPVIGASGKEWRIDVGVSENGTIKKLFEFVSPRSASVAAAVMKFSDIRASETIPSVAVLSDRSRTESALVSVLSRVAGAAIDASADPEVYKSAA